MQQRSDALRSYGHVGSLGGRAGRLNIESCPIDERRAIIFRIVRPNQHQGHHTGLLLLFVCFQRCWTLGLWRHMRGRLAGNSVSFFYRFFRFKVLLVSRYLAFC